MKVTNLRKAYGRTAFCPENDTALAQLNITLQSAQAAGVDMTNPVAAAAQAYYNQASGLFSGDWIALGSACTEDVSQAQTQITNLNSLITTASAAAGQAPPALVDPAQLPQPPASPFSALFPSIPSWVLPVGAGIIGLGLVAWLTSSVAKFRRRPA